MVVVSSTEETIVVLAVEEPLHNKGVMGLHAKSRRCSPNAMSERSFVWSVACSEDCVSRLFSLFAISFDTVEAQGSTYWRYYGQHSMTRHNMRLNRHFYHTFSPLPPPLPSHPFPGRILLSSSFIGMTTTYNACSICTDLSWLVLCELRK